MYCILGLLPLILMPLPLASPFFLAPCLALVYVSHRPCMYCAFLLSILLYCSLWVPSYVELRHTDVDASAAAAIVERAVPAVVAKAGNDTVAVDAFLCTAGWLGWRQCHNTTAWVATV